MLERSEGGRAIPDVVADEVPVLIVNDQAPFRVAARAVVQLAAGFVVAGEAESGEAAIEAAQSLEPAMVLMDMNLPGIDGLEATRAITARAPATVVVLLSTYDRASLPADAMESGAVRYVHKEDLCPGILREIWDGHGR